MNNEIFNSNWFIIKKEILVFKNLKIAQIDKSIYTRFKYFIKTIFKATLKNKIINNKIFILTKRILKILKNNEIEFEKFRTDSLLSSISFIILKQTVKMNMSTFMNYNSNLDVIELNKILNSIYSKLYFEKISYNVIN